MRARFRAMYGAGPLQLLALGASFALAAAAIVGWWQRSFDVGAVLVWFAGAIIAHDLVLFPLYALLDWIAFRRPRRSAPAGHVDHRAYVRIPAILSGLLLLVFFPLIFKLGAGPYGAASGMDERPYLARWLAATGVLFALAALAYAVALGRARGEEFSDNRA